MRPEPDMNTSQLVKLLGGAHALGRGLKSPLRLADRIEEGLPTLSLECMKAEMGLSDVEFSGLLGTSQKTISRLRQDPAGVLSRQVSDRLYRMARLFQLAVDVLAGRDAAREWLSSPKVGLANRIPLALLRTEAGSREVEPLLLRIEYGVIS
jgi:putative toxin-antitoxin system antitoxin component (TIGR02293 family)